MAADEPIDPRVRLAISQWPDDALRGAVSTFCPEQGVCRKSFYELCKRAKVDGPAAVLEPRTRHPLTSPAKLTDEVQRQAIGVPAALEASGLDHGPISVHDKIRTMDLDPVPSTASLARIFREAGPARSRTDRSTTRRPAKRPRPKLPAGLSADTRIRTVATTGTIAIAIAIDSVYYKVDVDRAFEHVLVIAEGEEPGDKVILADPQGELLAEHTRPAPGITYVGNGRPRARRGAESRQALSEGSSATTSVTAPG